MTKILIVDDSVFERAMLKSILERNGYSVIGEASNGFSAIQKYVELRPDIVTMDITMPEMDGITALEKIKEIDTHSKIIMITSMSIDDYFKKAVHLGSEGFILKPLNEQNIIETLAKVKGRINSK